MKRACVVLGVLALAGAWMQTATSATRQASVGNYWFQEDTQRDQTKITVRQGDQITFTIREAAVPGHTIDVDALGIHSPNLNIGQTYTTPRLTRPGNFYLYCRPHEQRGHHTRLVVLAAPRSTPAPAPRTTPAPTSAGATAAPARTASPVTATSKPTPMQSITPVGVGTAPPGSLERPVPTDPHSVEALTGHTRARGVPWTRSLWWLVFAAVPIVGAGAVALQRARIAEYQPKVEDLRRARAAPAKTKTARRKPAAKASKPPPRKRKR